MIVHDMPDEVYHARPELSSTGARLLLDSPARFRYWADNPRPPKRAFDLGHSLHAAVLGTGATIVEIPEEHLTPSGAMSTRAATREWEAEQRANGLVPIGAADAAKVTGMKESLLANPMARAILERIEHREVSVFADVDGVPCRARFDLYNGHQAADVKTTRSAAPGDFNRSVAAYGYDVQWRFYADVHAAETGETLGPFEFLVVESTPPFLSAVYSLDFVWEELGTEKAKKARELWRACTDKGEWPGYEGASLTPPSWAIYESAEQEIEV